jgi:hypothetical protein
MADASADPGTTSLITSLGNYGFGGLMTAALGYALWGLYRTHQEERKTWLDKLEQLWRAIFESQRESDAARHELAEEVRRHIQAHKELDYELKETLTRIASALDNHGRAHFNDRN